jgi:hypothetical protein
MLLEICLFAFVDRLINIKYWNPERLTLAVKAVDFVIFLVVEALHRKVLIIRLNSYFSSICDGPGSLAVYEMIMHQLRRIEQVNKEKVISDEGASDERVR